MIKKNKAIFFFFFFQPQTLGKKSLKKFMGLLVDLETPNGHVEIN